jgi:hypothetical protein
VHGDVVRERVQHDHGVDVVEDACASHHLLAAADLLGGSADQRHAPAHALLHLRRGEEAIDGRGTDDVVPQPWPMSRNALYSASTAMCGPSPPRVAISDVSRPPIPISAR